MLSNKLSFKVETIQNEGDDLLWNTCPDFFDCLFRICFGENDDGVELGVVQLVDGVRGDVEQGVLAAIHDVADRGEANDAGLAGRTRALTVAGSRHAVTRIKF